MGKQTENKTITEDNIKKAEFNFRLASTNPISQTAIDPEVTSVPASMRREERNIATDGYRPIFDKLSLRKRLIFLDDQIAVLFDLRKLIDILYFGHCGTTKMLSDEKNFWGPEVQKDI